MIALRKTSACVSLLLVMLWGCAAPDEPLTHNDPSRYALAANVPWSAPEGFDLSMDIYTPRSGKASYPVLVIFHGGGWLINDKSIMDQAAKYVVSNGEYVVCNVDYRLLGDQGNSVTLNEIVNDAFGAVLWVKDNIASYGGDPDRVALTGDSAGAHLAAAVVNLGPNLSSNGYSQSNLAFQPSYLPEGITAEQVALDDGLAVQAAVLSYGVFDLATRASSGFESWQNPFWYFGGALPRGLFGSDYSLQSHPELYRGVSPAHNIPEATERLLPPQLLTAGSEDSLTTPESVQGYQAALIAAGQTAMYWEYEGKGHAFLDSGSNPLLGVSFADNAPAALEVMLGFLNEVFYP